ncbi:MAG: response regulator [Candidatus Rokuibacteriota bacterium]|nr:MAG: response regulator [Candidatus Rokubacteria bacterium]
MLNMPDLRGIHVLIVDDNEDARLILGAYLQHLGAHITLAASGAEGLAALAEIRAHVIVSDLSMPVMDGMEFLRRVRQLPGQVQAPTPAIAFTGFTDRYSETRARAAGFQVLLAKPTDPVEIAELIARMARQRGSDAQSA